MTLEEMKMAVSEKLPNLIELCEGPSKLHPCWINNKGRPIHWPTEGLQVCHEAEKLLTEKEAVWYLQKLTQIRYKAGVSGMIACMIDKAAHATYEQRLEALCRVWFPERF